MKSARLFLRPIMLVFTNLALLIFLSFTELHAQNNWSLQQCIDSALVNNGIIRSAEATLQSAQARTAESRSQLLPKINVQGDYRYYNELPVQLMPLSVFNGPPEQFKTAQFGVPNNISAGVSLNVPLYNATVLQGINIAEAGVENVKAQNNKTRETLIYDITLLYYDAQLLSQRLAVLDSNITNLEKLSVKTSIAVTQKTARQTDLSRIELQILQLKTQRKELNYSLIQIISLLRLQMGIQDGTLFIISPLNFTAGKENYDPRPSSEAKITEAQYNFLKQEMIGVRRMYLPAVSLYGYYGTNGYGFNGTTNDFLNFYPVSFAGIQITYPLFTGFNTRRKYNTRKFETESVRYRLDYINASDRIRTENAALKRESAYNWYVASQQQLNLAISIYNQTLLQHSEGTASMSDLLLADNSLRDARMNLADAQIRILKADLELKKISGNI